MSDIALTSNAGDIDLTGHRLSLITGEAAIQQSVFIRLRFFYEEWFLDKRLGVPYYRDVLVKNPNLDLVRSLFREAVRTTPGISTVPEMDLVLDATTRELDVTFTAVMDTGEALTFGPFIVEI